MKLMEIVSVWMNAKSHLEMYACLHRYSLPKPHSQYVHHKKWMRPEGMSVCFYQNDACRKWIVLFAHLEGLISVSTVENCVTEGIDSD